MEVNLLLLSQLLMGIAVVCFLCIVNVIVVLVFLHTPFEYLFVLSGWGEVDLDNVYFGAYVDTHVDGDVSTMVILMIYHSNLWISFSVLVDLEEEEE